jgi:hypothetical protein
VCCAYTETNRVSPLPKNTQPPMCAPASSCLTCVWHFASHTRWPGPGAGAGAGAFTAFFLALLASSVRCGPLALPCSHMYELALALTR